MSMQKNSWSIVSLILITCSAIGLVFAYPQSPSRGGVALVNQDDTDSDRFVEIKTISTGGPAGTRNHHSLAAFHEAEAMIAKDGRRLRAQAFMKQRGSVISPHPDATGDVRVLQEKLAALLSQQDPVPLGRLIHFRWCDTPDLGLRGWKGTIKDVVRAPQGLLMTIEMRPYLVSQLGGITDTPDHVIETYLYSNGHMAFLDCKEPAGTGLAGALFVD